MHNTFGVLRRSPMILCPIGCLKVWATPNDHDDRKAFRQVLRLLDTDHDGVLTTTEKEQAAIVIYGHGWGASETVSLARRLGQKGIPVLLTIQVDSLRSG